MNVLIADDFEPNRRLLRRVLTESGFGVLEAPDGLEAWRIVQSQPVALVIADILMPGMDGYQLCAQIRRDPRLKDVPYIVFTGIADSPDDEARAKGAGADLFVRKPWPAWKLVEEVRALVANPAARRTGPPQPPPPVPPAAPYTDQLVARLEERNVALVLRTQELHATNEKLSYARQFYDAQLDQFPALLWRSGSDAKCVHFNRGWLEFTGRTMEQEIGDGWLEGVHPEDAGRVCAEYLEAFEARRPFELEYRLRRHDGEYRSIVDHGRPYQELDGSFAGYIGTGFDVTEREQTEEALRRRDVQFEEAQQMASMGFWDWDLETGAVQWSEQLYRTYGLTPETFAPSYEAFAGRIHPDDRVRVGMAVKGAFATGAPYDIEFRVVRSDESVRVLHGRARVTLNAAGKPMRLYGVAQDITERKQVEEELRQTKGRLEMLSRRLLETSEAELRRIARELHDEIGQTLTATKLEILAAKRTSDPATVVLRLDDSLALVEHLLQSVRELSLNLRPASLDALGLSGALKAHATAITARAELRLIFTVTPSDASCAPCDSEVEIACFRVAQEALTNVLRHAQASKVEIHLEPSAAGLLLRLQDDGLGFDYEAAMAGAVEGRSFGLFGMRERAELTGGHFTCETRPGAGTQITAFFRCCHERPCQS